jgi:uncharacterized protein (TIGR02597 family)
MMPATLSRLGYVVPRKVDALWFALTLLSLPFAGAHLRAASLVSEPVGCVRVVIPSPAPGETTRKVLGIPFNRASLFRGIVTSVSGSTIKAGTPAWTSGQFVSAVHYLKFRTGPNAGRYFTVTGNTADTLTVSAPGVAIAEKQVFEIVPAQTLGSLFGTTSVALRTGPDEASADLVRIQDGNVWNTYFHNGAQWLISGGTASQNGTIIRPEQGLIVVAGGTSPVSLALRGSVSITSEASLLPGSGEALVANRLPFDTTLSALKIQSLSGWTKGASASVADNLMRWDGSSWNVYYHTGARWQMAGSQASQDGASLPVGEALLIRRREGSTASATFLDTAAPFAYTLSE